ncbi:bifunctional uridylate/adenylate kinase KNAG_0H00140 [Huiozyma naganishii CBS 8797]|uniref:Uridylate kinase n=1 Tax=Huiozyma naganishii (strain ATCC MYA-139 / BCRC 22969 / CBS 8797 / KCTC 17520 / NBRC 10181 / NCYC 3082 / Yp74L-3) TaxID=1071383 RepID=J7R988_HUIN7|nr:hypothetical protein KNAG_0H00140 [Kazachstania naganishii CBS 8797]CCK71430.1 hypothetical protein KNAG_0H00140 [Kazachstania naganishii CBS 8797]
MTAPLRGIYTARVLLQQSSRKTTFHTEKFSKQTVDESDPKKKDREPKKRLNRNSVSGKQVAVVGLLALGTTILSLLYSKSKPVEFLEEDPTPAEMTETAGRPIFTPEEVSVIFVLGGPGAGKGTQCDNLVRDYHFVHLSAGDLLRAEQNRPDSEYGKLIKHYITEGLIVPQEITVKLLENAIRDNFKEGRTKFLVDGFPRKMDQAITFEDVIVPSKFVLFFDCPEEVMEKRLLERGKTSGRADDNIESIKKRFKTFVETSMPVIEYFEEQNKVIKIKCDKSVEEVYNDVQQQLKGKI